MSSRIAFVVRCTSTNRCLRSVSVSAACTCGYDKRADIHEAFLSLGCALICWQEFFEVSRFRGSRFVGYRRYT
jgi:hypothetical protein